MTLQAGFGGAYENRRRRQNRGRILRFIAFAIIVSLFFYWGYEMGQDHAVSENSRLEESLRRQTEEAQLLRKEAESAVAARAAAESRAAEIQRQYLTEVPQGPAKEIAVLVNQRLEEGVSADRIAFVVGAVQDETRCQEELSSRRFIVQTPFTNGANSAITFADNTITVSAIGEPARNANGDPEAWFAKDQPVTITFTLIGGREMQATGMLPLQHSVVVDDTDHRFAITPESSRGFVRVTEQLCAYP